ncbi:MAG: DUF3159 domain-containing protein [Actinomycetota bacterium]|nr:MAG: DUF3159 domain-containing protein [Actinomycetota bacterium]
MTPGRPATDEALLTEALGGWRGLLDSAAPPLVFVICYVATSELTPSLWASLGAAFLVAVIRLWRRQPLRQIVGGVIGIAVSAYFASRTGKAEDFFLPGLLINLGYAAVFVVSLVVRWPLVGVVVGGLTGDVAGWRADRRAYRAAQLATLVWIGSFLLRVAVQWPLYAAGMVAALGAAKIVLGWPVYLATLWITYLLMRPTLARRRQAVAEAAGTPPAADTESESR